MENQNVVSYSTLLLKSGFVKELVSPSGDDYFAAYSKQLVSGIARVKCYTGSFIAEFVDNDNKKQQKVLPPINLIKEGGIMKTGERNQMILKESYNGLRSVFLITFNVDVGLVNPNQE